MCEADLAEHQTMLDDQNTYLILLIFFKDIDLGREGKEVRVYKRCVTGSFSICISDNECSVSLGYERLMVF